MVEIVMKKGPWTPEEDEILSSYIKREGGGRWRTLPKKAGLRRCGKSCRLRWMNYLRPSVKRGGISLEEEDLILRLHRLLGNRWALIAGRIPGRTDNEIKNYWNTNLSKKLISQGIDPRTHKPLSSSSSNPNYQNFVHISCSMEQPEVGLPNSNEIISNPNSNKDENKEDEILSYSADDATVLIPLCFTSLGHLEWSSQPPLSSTFHLQVTTTTLPLATGIVCTRGDRVQSNKEDKKEKECKEKSSWSNVVVTTILHDNEQPRRMEIVCTAVVRSHVDHDEPHAQYT
ncbi:unnamed protein product [Lactuca saligna]|uniref:Uncharacterized protein n=1 Tax=Lactuca saligna TaxID=75948 RepID=A0AA35ZD03_LACSI|nr:unnamed protein product [Lactuca saligna]